MKKILICLLALVMCFAVVSCGGEKQDDKKDNGGNTEVTLGAVEDISSYKLLRGDTCSDEQKTAAITLRKALAEVIGSSPRLGTDYDGETAKEILIGTTKRSASVEAESGLKYFDFVIKQDGEKIVIAGGSDEAITEAVNYFIENYIDTANKKVSVPTGDGYFYKHATVFDKLSVDGVDITEFKIYNNSALTGEELTSFASNLKKTIVGSDIEYAEKSTSKLGDGGHYIVLDGTNLDPYAYSITVEDGNLVIKGSHHTLPLAIEEFLGNFSTSIGERDHDLTSADNKVMETERQTIPYTKEQLMTLLTDVANDDSKVIVGEQVDVSSDIDQISNTVERYAEASNGEYQSILGIDLAVYGLRLMERSDEKWSAYICDLVDYCAKGGIITASSHFANPGDPAAYVRGNILGPDRSSGTLEEYEAAFEALLTEGTEYNTFWKNELAEDARFLKALGDAGVTVLWRPLHEANGNWFWYCTTQASDGGAVTLDASYLQRMWVYIYNYYENELGLTNLLWSFGPNTCSNVDDNPGTAMSPWYLYPGDEYVDMVGVDWYTGGNLEITHGDNYTTFLEKTGKIGSITEFGPSGPLMATEGQNQADIYSCMDLYGTMFELMRDYEYNISYVLTWTSVWSIVGMGRSDEMMATDMFLSRADVLEMFNAMN